ncbi:MAG: STAS domain-containing protein [Phycisphaerales bacterium]|jgi:anti-anti-sigma factor|nr:STAS domain-containing protein [Phycisphaerales bacterium]
MQLHPREIDGDIMVLAVDGGLDGTTSAGFTDDVLSIVDGGVKRLILDCSGLTAVTSVGIGALLRLHARAARLGGDVKLAGVQALPMQVLRLMRLDAVFELYDTVDRARLAFRPPAED